MDDLLRLKLDTERYVQSVFDWASPLGHHQLLGQLYDFQAAIEQEIKIRKGDTQ